MRVQTFCVPSLTMFLLFLTFPSLSLSLRAQNADDYGPVELRAFFKDVAQQYRFEPRQLELIEQPLLHWANPVRTQEQGGLYVWTEDGRPAVLASIFSYRLGTRIFYKHEIVSVSDHSLKASLDGRRVWEPAKSAATWKTVDAQPPAGNPSRRLAQIRAMSRQFAGEKTELDSTIVKLKTMPQPLFRYKSAEQKVIDGAIFGLVEATDPEIYLLIEAFEVAGAAKWRYAAVPSHWLDMKLYLRKEVVWKTELNTALKDTREGQVPYSQQGYFSFYSNDPLPPAETLGELAAEQARTEKAKAGTAKAGS